MRVPHIARAMRLSHQSSTISSKMAVTTQDFSATMKKCDKLYKTIPMSNMLQFQSYTFEVGGAKVRTSPLATASLPLSTTLMMQNRSTHTDVAHLYKKIAQERIRNPVPTGSLHNLVHTDRIMDRSDRIPFRSIHYSTTPAALIHTSRNIPVLSDTAASASGTESTRDIQAVESLRPLDKNGRHVSLDDIMRGARKALAKALVHEHVARNPKEKPGRSKNDKGSSPATKRAAFGEELTTLEEELLLVELHGQPAKNEFDSLFDPYPSTLSPASSMTVSPPSPTSGTVSGHLELERIRERAAEIRGINPTAAIDIPNRADAPETLGSTDGKTNVSRRNVGATGSKVASATRPRVPHMPSHHLHREPGVGKRRFSSTAASSSNSRDTGMKRPLPIWRLPFRSPILSSSVDRQITQATKRSDRDINKSLDKSKSAEKTMAEVAAETAVIHEIAGPLLKEKMSNDPHASAEYWDKIIAKYSKKLEPESSRKAQVEHSTRSEAVPDTPAPRIEDIRGPLLDEKLSKK